MKFLLVLASMLLLSACQPPINSSEMMPLSSAYHNLSQKGLFQDNLIVRDVTVIPNTGSDGGGAVTEPQFRETLNTALRMADMSATDDAKAKYYLDANITEVVRDFIGFNMEATVACDYKVTNIKSNKQVFNESVRVPHEAGIADAFNGAVRQRLAAAYAARENVTHAIKLLSRVKK